MAVMDASELRYPIKNMRIAMSYLDEVIEKLKLQYPYLSSEFGIKRIGIFGSIAKRDETNESDIDLVVEFNRPIGLKFMRLADYLEKLLGRKVDILTKEGINNIRVKRVAIDIEKDIIYV